MKIFDTSTLDEKAFAELSPNEAAWIYNGLDVCVTAEVYEELKQQIANDDPCVGETYKTACAKLAPIMEMSLRGTKINEQDRTKTIKELEKDLTALDKKFQRIMTEVFGGPVSWSSPTQLKGLFYGALKLKERKSRNTNGVWTATVNRDALEYFQKHYLYARPLASFVLILRDLQKQITYLKTKIDPDGRIRSTYNLAGTNTGRLASSASEFGTGTNLQNADRRLRYPFVADPGMYMVNIDLEQADGRNVGAIGWSLFYESHGPEFAGSYLDACESGDLHTMVSKMTWPELDWPEDPTEWKKFCDGVMAHGQDSYRQLAKKLGHGSNYYGTPPTMAKHTHTPTKVIEDFQTRYFGRFPVIPAWQQNTIDKIKEDRTITTLFGRRRTFFGRPQEAATHRKAIAYAPQSMTGEQIDRGLLQIWRKFKQVQLLNQVHDSVLLQVPFSEAEDLIPEILEAMKVTLILPGDRPFTVPLDAAGGWNWGYFNPKKPNDNPYGLSKWRGKEKRDRPNPRRRFKDYLKGKTL